MSVKNNSLNKKMAARSRKRLHITGNKLLEFDKIQLTDIICSICQSILIEPVTLPCHHNFCKCCFKSSVENNALCCPLCRLRIGSWLRTTTKQNKIVDTKLWEFIKSKFSSEVESKLQGEDIHISPEQITFCVSNPGEIRAEYEAELKRLQTERQELEQKQLQQTTLLINKIQKEEDEMHTKYLETLKQDVMLAQQVQHEQNESSAALIRLHQPAPVTKTKLKSSRIDDYLTKKMPAIYKSVPVLTDDSTNSTNSSDSIINQTKLENRGSPEIVPSYNKFQRYKLEKKGRNISGFWNKENGDNCQVKKDDILPQVNNANSTDGKDFDKVQTSTQSLPVSLPYTGILQHKMNLLDKRSVGSGSVDSMRQELCYFKPVQGTTATSYNAKRGLPIKVPVMRLEKSVTLVPREPPTYVQYAEALSVLRNRSLAQNLPSAFAIVLCEVRPTQRQSLSRATATAKDSPETDPSPAVTTSTSTRRKHSTLLDGIRELNKEITLRRTRSMGSINKNNNETTPKKTIPKLRQVSSERKPYLRSQSKKMNAQQVLNTSPVNADSVNNNKVNLAVRLSSPLQRCDKKFIEEQIRIVSQIEQEKKDFELASKMDADLDRRLRLRRPPVKRHLRFNYTLRPAKKLKT